MNGQDEGSTDQVDPSEVPAAAVGSESVPVNTLSNPTQTPLFRALNRDRYARQDRIREIEARTGRRLLCWVAEPHAEINKYDVIPMGDLLHDLTADEDIDLMLESAGGDIDVAEKIVMMIRERCRSFRVIVPEAAKSAATLIAIAADSILMGYTSELGPIDPQIPVPTPGGTWVLRPAQSFLDGLETIKEAVAKEGTLSPAYFPVLQQVDPALLDFCQKAIDRSKAFAEKWLKQYQCASEPDKAAGIAAELGNVKKHLSHGAAIDHETADRMGLNVEYLPPYNDLWDALWRLYCDYVMALRSTERGQIFEGRTASVSY